MAGRDWCVSNILLIAISVMTKGNRQNCAKLKPGEALCHDCVGKCCRYFALPIDTPTTPRILRYPWYLLHERATCSRRTTVVPAGPHAVQAPVAGPSLWDLRHATPDLPRVYDGWCEYDDDWTYERYFETPEQIQEYAEAVLETPGAGYPQSATRAAPDSAEFWEERCHPCPSSNLARSKASATTCRRR